MWNKYIRLGAKARGAGLGMCYDKGRVARGEREGNCMTTPYTLMLGDCKERLAALESDSVDLIFTSPPYADQRKHTYGGVHPDQYVEWFMPIGAELLRVLRPTGTFVLNIKERVVEGERHTYVIDLIKALRGQGWLWTEEFVWHKKNSYPGKWPNRFRDAWERLLQFNKDKLFHM
jgi:DNA modification methylase